MKRNYYVALPLAAFMLTIGCKDSNYDLSDIDTTSKVIVKDLVVPVNLAPVKLSSIIEIDDESSDKSFFEEEIDGQKYYVFRTSGDFNGDVKIESFSVSPEPIESNTVNIDLKDVLPTPLNRKKAKEGVQIEPLEYHIKYQESSFKYTVSDISSSIETVKSIQTPEVSLSLTLNLPNSMMKDLSSIYLTDVVLTFPDNLYMNDSKTPAEVFIDGKKGFASYNPADGTVKMNGNTSYEISSKGIFKIEVKAQELSVKGQGSNPEEGLKINGGEFDYNGKIAVNSGVLIMTPKPNTIPESHFEAGVDYDLSSFTIDNFSGKIDYKLDDLAFDDLKLNNLPDFLNQSGTSISIADPQLYISLNNPCAPYDLEAKTGLTIIPKRDGVAEEGYIMNDILKVPYNKGEGPFNYVINRSGKTPSNIVDDYANPIPTPLEFRKLGEILSGDGIPTTLEIKFENPDASVFGFANKFPLQPKNATQNIVHPVKGNYEFRAPLALSDGSVIGYSDTTKDWDSDELKDLHINLLEISADALSEIPLEVELSAKLRNSNGDFIGKCEPITLEASSSSPILLKITPDTEKGEEELTDINGIEYSITARSNTPADETPTLSPDMSITLDNLKARINGYYLYKDDKYKDKYENK